MRPLSTQADRDLMIEAEAVRASFAAQVHFAKATDTSMFAAKMALLDALLKNLATINPEATIAYLDACADVMAGEDIEGAADKRETAGDNLQRAYNRMMNVPADAA